MSLDCAVPGCPNAILWRDLCALHMPDHIKALSMHSQDTKALPALDNTLLPMYSQDRWDRLLDSTIAKIKSLAKLKGGEYSGDTDRLANFRRHASALGLSQDHVSAVYAGKN